jgi:DNA-binding transcriptional MerR regulator
MQPDSRYPIGDVARRTGLSVSAVRYYSDEGIVVPAGLNDAGHRVYDLRGIARLEIIRTLRDLGTGLGDIRRMLDGEMTLHQLLTGHLELVERQERDLRARRAVLRALTKQEAPAARAALMHRLVAMSDTERERLIDEFWDDVAAEMPDGFAARLRDMRPRLPDDPGATQLEAWIELADLLRDESFRDGFRGYLRDTFATEPGSHVAADPVQDFIHGPGQRVMEEILAAHRSGLPADSGYARDLAMRLADGAAEAAGVPATRELRDRLAEGYLVIDEHYAEASVDPHYDATHGRYLSLVSAINGTNPDNGLPHGLGAWLATALRAPHPTFHT